MGEVIERSAVETLVKSSMVCLLSTAYIAIERVSRRSRGNVLDPLRRTGARSKRSEGKEGKELRTDFTASSAFRLRNFGSGRATTNAQSLDTHTYTVQGWIIVRDMLRIFASRCDCCIGCDKRNMPTRPLAVSRFRSYVINRRYL